MKADRGIVEHRVCEYDNPDVIMIDAAAMTIQFADRVAFRETVHALAKTNQVFATAS